MNNNPYFSFPQYQQPYVPASQPMQPINNNPVGSIGFQQNDVKRTNAEWIFVNGIQQVREHIVQPNQTLYFMDNNSPAIYCKTADNFGTTQLKAYRLEEINPDYGFQSNVQPNDESELRQEISMLREQIERHEKAISELVKPMQRKAVKNESSGTDGNK